MGHQSFSSEPKEKAATGSRRRLNMDSKRSGIVLVLVVLASFVSAQKSWVPSEDIADTLERMCSITCQAGNDQDRKGFCAVYTTLVRLNTKDGYTDAMMEEVEKKCMGSCKKVSKGNNSHKEARNKMCKSYGNHSYTITLPAKPCKAGRAF